MTRQFLFHALLIATACFLWTGSASAEKAPIVPADEFLAAFDDLRADLEEGVPRELSRREWRDFDRIHQRFQYLLSDVDDATQLPSQQQLALYNLQGELDGLIMGGIRDQRVCTEQRNVGSRIARRNCRTVAEIEEERIRARDWLQSFPLQLQGPQG
ncbi:MAG: hypothetical protein EA370_13755 [Wenzhouxiangella sp.]|nr:MAG: hypothetical protein EA370_13755 [Wenzhouxiangella sp.]